MTTDATAGAVRSVLAAVQAVRLCEEQTAARHGMSAAQLAIIALLGREGPCSVGEIAEHLHVHQSSVSPLVSRLTKERFVRRKPAVDTRRVEVVLTARGRRVAEKVGLTGRPLLEASLAGLPAKTVELLVDTLEKLTAALLEQRAISEKRLTHDRTGKQGSKTA